MDHYVLLITELAGIAWLIGFAVRTYWFVGLEVVSIVVVAVLVRSDPLWPWAVLAIVLGFVMAAGTFARRSLTPVPK